MTRLKMIGWTAMAVAVLGYGGAIAIGVLFRLDYLPHLDRMTVVALVSAVAVVGEVGLWIAAGCLGLTIFKRRKALFDRLFRRGSPARV